MLYIVINAIIFGAGSFIVARDKNRNPFLWGALGLIIGPFALLIVAMMKPAPGPNQNYQ